MRDGDVKGGYEGSGGVRGGDVKGGYEGWRCEGEDVRGWRDDV